MTRILRLIIVLLFSCSPALAQTVISNVYVQSSTSTTATIVWTTSTAATSQIKYGFSSSSIPYANSTNFSLVTSHSMTLPLLNASQPYYFAVVSTDASGIPAQSSTVEFSLCGSPTVPVTGTVNFAYGGGTYTLTYNPPSGSSGPYTVCGQTITSPVSGTLNTSGSFTAVVADALKVTPGPGTWSVAVAGAGSIGSITVTAPISAQNQDLSGQLQAAAVAVGLTPVTATASTCNPAWVCLGSGSVVNPGANYALPAYQLSTGRTLGPSNVTVDSTGNKLTVPGTVAAQNLPRNAITYGADPTNTTDSSSAITSCMQAGVGCYIPPGNYKISATIRMPNCSGSNKSISIWGDPGTHPNAYPAVLNVASGVTAFAPACPLTAYQGVSIQNLEIFGGKNGIDLGYVNLTDLGHITLWNQSGYGITHLQGEKHHWHDIFIWHQTVQGIGGISLCDPTTTADATVYAGDSFWGVNNGWFDRATLEDITDMGNGASPQDSYFVHAAGPSGGNIGSGAISHTIFIKPVIMWAGAIKTWDIEGFLQWVTIEEPIFDIIGSASTPVTDVLYVAGGSNTVTLLDFSPTDSPGDYYTNGVHFVGGTNNVSIIDSNFGGDGTTTYGVRLDTVAGPLELINSTGYVQNNWSNVAFQYNGVSVIGGHITSNLTPTYVSNTAGGDYRFYMPLLTPSNTNNCNNWRFSRGASSPTLAVLDDMYMGCSGAFFNVPLNMGASSYFTGSANVYSYWNWTNTNSGGGANNMTLTVSPTNPGSGAGHIVVTGADFSAPAIIPSSLTPGTSPVCANGTSGALTNVGCAGASSVPWHGITNPSSNLSLNVGANKSTFTNTNVFTAASSFTSPWQYAGSGMNFGTDWNDIYSAYMPNAYPSDEMDVGISVPNTSAAFQSDAFGAYADCAQPSGLHYCIANYAQARRTAAGASLGAVNGNVTDDNLSGANMLSGEFNSQVFNVGTSGWTLYVQANISNANTPYDGIGIVTNLGKYRNGIAIGDDSATTAISLGKLTSTSGSEPITFKNATTTGSLAYNSGNEFLFTSAGTGNNVAAGFIGGTTGANIQVGTDSTNAGNSMYLTMQEPGGSGSTSNFAALSVAGAAVNSLDVFKNGGVSIGSSATPSIPPGSGLNVGTTSQFSVDGSGNVTTTSAGSSAAMKVTNTNTGASGQAYLGTGYLTYQGYKDATPSEAFALGWLTPGGSVGNNATFSYYNGTAWAEAWHVNAANGQVNFPQAVIAPTASVGTNTTQVATTAFVQAALPVKISNSITPAAATASSCVEQTFTYTGLVTTQQVSVSPPASLGAHIWIGSTRVSAANTLAISFCADATAGTPPSGTYIAVAF